MEMIYVPMIGGVNSNLSNRLWERQKGGDAIYTCVQGIITVVVINANFMNDTYDQC